MLYLSCFGGIYNIMIKAIFVDMDGTLLGKSQVAVSVRNMAALQAALDKGIHVIPCTGRVYTMLPPQLLTYPGLRYFVTSHGARVYDREKNCRIYEDLNPPETWDSDTYDKKKFKITCAGMPKACHKWVNFENFRIGNSFTGKLQPKRVNGGVVLMDVDFTIKV